MLPLQVTYTKPYITITRSEYRHLQIFHLDIDEAKELLMDLTTAISQALSKETPSAG